MIWRKIRFSLRSLIGFVLLVSCGALFVYEFHYKDPADVFFRGRTPFNPSATINSSTAIRVNATVHDGHNSLKSPSMCSADDWRDFYVSNQPKGLNLNGNYVRVYYDRFAWGDDPKVNEDWTLIFTKDREIIDFVPMSNGGVGNKRR